MSEEQARYEVVSMNYEDMTDRELDEHVIHNVMGWWGRALETTDEGWVIMSEDKKTIINNGNNFSPSTDISAAWEVLERVRKTHGLYEIAQASDEYWVEIQLAEGKVTSKADSAPRAICIAALKALEQ